MSRGGEQPLEQLHPVAEMARLEEVRARLLARGVAEPVGEGPTPCSLATMSTARRLAGALGLVGGYAVAVRPRVLRWGATDEEVRRPYPGGDLVPGETRSAMMACTIEAAPSRVWPWLVQMGVDRAGWYGWDRLDSFGRRSAECIHPIGRRSRGHPPRRAAER